MTNIFGVYIDARQVVAVAKIVEGDYEASYVYFNGGARTYVHARQADVVKALEAALKPQSVDPLSNPESIRKFGIMHPSDRAYGLDVNRKEVWGADDPILFDTKEEARARIDERAKQYPNGDWPQARVVPCRPGKPRVYPTWEWE